MLFVVILCCFIYLWLSNLNFTNMNKASILAAIQQYKGFKSDKAFANALGITPQAYSRWIARNTFDLEKVRKAFPDISVEWLATGQGNMLKQQIDNVRVSPVIPDDLVRQQGVNVLDWIEANPNDTEQLKVSHILPPFEIFYRVVCDAMKPNVEKGDILALKHIPDKTKVIDGECYVVDSANHGLIIRRLYYKGGVYTCECNLKELGTIEIAEKDVFSVFSIVGLIRLRVSSHSETVRLWSSNDKKDKHIAELLEQQSRLIRQNEKLLDMLQKKDSNKKADR